MCEEAAKVSKNVSLVKSVPRSFFHLRIHNVFFVVNTRTSAYSSSSKDVTPRLHTSHTPTHRTHPHTHTSCYSADKRATDKGAPTPNSASNCTTHVVTTLRSAVSADARAMAKVLKSLLEHQYLEAKHLAGFDSYKVRTYSHVLSMLAALLNRLSHDQNAEIMTLRYRPWISSLSGRIVVHRKQRFHSI